MAAAGRLRLATVLLLAAGAAAGQSSGPAAGSTERPAPTERPADADPAAAAALRECMGWLRRRRDARDGGWGNHTAAAVLALQLTGRPRGGGAANESAAAAAAAAERWAAPSNPEGLLAVKQMELELVLHLWRWKNALLRVESASKIRHHEAPITTGKLAQYTLALNAVCKDPKKFYGHDLINMLQHHEAELDYEFAFSSLAVCSSGAHVRKRQIRRLLEIAERVNDHNVDTLSMVLLALKCIVQDHRNRNLDQYIPRPMSGLAQQQQPDGSFVGSVHSTALAMQALETEDKENKSLGGLWNHTAAVSFLRSRQGSDGSFSDVPTTAEVILALGPHSLAGVKDMGCPTPPAVKFVPPVLPAALTPKGSHHHHHHKHTAGSNGAKGSNASHTNNGTIYGNNSLNINSVIIGMNNSGATTTMSSTSVASSISNNNANTSGNAKTGDITDSSESGNNHLTPSAGNANAEATVNLTTLESLAGSGKQPDLVKVIYSIWVHSNISESYNLTVQAERNTTFYNVMLSAAQEDAHYQFEATEWPNGHYVHTLAGYKEEPTSYYFWLLYQTVEMPDPANPPGNQLITPVGVDGLLIDEGNHFLFWYKKL